MTLKYTNVICSGTVPIESLNDITTLWPFKILSHLMAMPPCLTYDKNVKILLEVPNEGNDKDIVRNKEKEEMGHFYV